MDRRSRTFVLSVAVALSVGLVLVVWSVGYLPTQDGAQHILQSYLVNHYGDAARGYDRYLEPGQAVSALGFTLVFSSVEPLLGWRDAFRVVQAVTVLVWAWGFFALVAALHPKRLALGLLGFATAFQWAFYMGFFSFVMATGIGFVVLALALEPHPWTLRRRALIAGLLFLQAIVHVFPTQLVGFALVLLVSIRTPRHQRLKQLGWLALMALPALAIAVLCVDPAEGAGPFHVKRWLGGAQRLRLLASAFTTGPCWRAWLPLLAALAGLVAAGRRLVRRRARAAETALGATALLLLALSLLAPLHLSGWEYFSPRFLPLGTMLGVALLPVEALPPLRRPAITFLGGSFAVAAITWSALYHHDLERRTAVALSGLGQPLERSGPRLSLVLDPNAGGPAARHDGTGTQVPFMTPLFTMGALYAVEQGGIPTWMFSSRSRVHSFVFSEQGRRRYPAVHDPIQVYDPRILQSPERRRALLTWLAALGARYEDVILWGSPADGELFVRRGYVADYRRGGLLIGRFAGCPTTIRILADRPFEHEIIVQYGWDPAHPPTGEYVIPPGSTPAAGAYRIQPRACLCGPVWYRVALDVDGNSVPSAADRFCDDAGPQGIHLRVAAPSPSEVVCELR